MDPTQIPAPTNFDNIRRYTAQGVPFWRARQIQEMLGYKAWHNFENSISKAMAACSGAGMSVKVHFNETVNVKEKSNGGRTEEKDYFLTRHACYLIAMNSEANIPEVSAAMTYFSIQTQRQERTDQHLRDSERLEWRGRLTDRTKKLASVAKEAGVHNYALFNDAGYRGLYGMRLSQLLERKKLHPDAKLFDNIGTTELAANAFRATQAAEILRREKIHGQLAASTTHEMVGAQVRDVIKKLGNTMPENLPTEPDIQLIEQRVAKSRLALADKKEPCPPLNQPNQI